MRTWSVCWNFASYQPRENSGRRWKNWTFNTGLAPKPTHRWRWSLMATVSNLHPPTAKVRSRSNNKSRRENSTDLKEKYYCKRRSITSRLYSLCSTGREWPVRELKECTPGISSWRPSDSILMFRVQMRWTKFFLLPFLQLESLAICLLILPELQRLLLYRCLITPQLRVKTTPIYSRRRWVTPRSTKWSRVRATVGKRAWTKARTKMLLISGWTV